MTKSDAIDLLMMLSWGGFYAYSIGYEHYREMLG